jgi:transcriptional regulator with XRE-family HTH domain
MQIGKKIRELREAKRMTLKELSEQSGVQIATLSRIENGKMTGTIDSHINISKALGTDITQLYKGIDISPNGGQELPSIDQSSESFAYNDKASYEILATKILTKKMLPMVLRIEPGGKTNMEQHPSGSEKFIFILEGRIAAHIGNNYQPLIQHQTLYFDASLPHFFTNSSEVVAKVIVVVTPVAL